MLRALRTDVVRGVTLHRGAQLTRLVDRLMSQRGGAKPPAASSTQAQQASASQPASGPAAAASQPSGGDAASIPEDLNKVPPAVLEEAKKKMEEGGTSPAPARERQPGRSSVPFAQSLSPRRSSLATLVSCTTREKTLPRTERRCPLSVAVINHSCGSAVRAEERVGR